MPPKRHKPILPYEDETKFDHRGIYYQRLKAKLLAGTSPQKDRFRLGMLQDVLKHGAQPISPSDPFHGIFQTPQFLGKYPLNTLTDVPNIDLADDLQNVGALGPGQTPDQFIDTLAQYGTKGLFGNTYVSAHDVLKGIINPQIKQMHQDQGQLGEDLQELGNLQLDAENQIRKQTIAKKDQIQQQTFDEFQKAHYHGQTTAEFFQGVAETQKLQREQLYEQTANEALITKQAAIKKIDATSQQQEIQDQNILGARGLGGSSIAQNITTQNQGQSQAQKGSALTDYAQKVSQAAQFKSESALQSATQLSDAKQSQTNLRLKSYNLHQSTAKQHVLNAAGIQIQQIGIEFQYKRIAIQQEVDKIKGIIASLQQDLIT